MRVMIVGGISIAIPVCELHAVCQDGNAEGRERPSRAFFLARVPPHLAGRGGAERHT